MNPWPFYAYFITKNRNVTSLFNEASCPPTCSLWSTSLDRPVVHHASLAWGYTRWPPPVLPPHFKWNLWWVPITKTAGLFFFKMSKRCYLISHFGYSGKPGVCHSQLSDFQSMATSIWDAALEHPIFDTIFWRWNFCTEAIIDGIACNCKCFERVSCPCKFYSKVAMPPQRKDCTLPKTTSILVGNGKINGNSPTLCPLQRHEAQITGCNWFQITEPWTSDDFPWLVTTFSTGTFDCHPTFGTALDHRKGA